MAVESAGDAGSTARPAVMAHRGASRAEAENTVAAFRRAGEMDLEDPLARNGVDPEQLDLVSPYLLQPALASLCAPHLVVRGAVEVQRTIEVNPPLRGGAPLGMEEPADDRLLAAARAELDAEPTRHRG